MGIEVSPSELNVNPKLVRGGAIVVFLFLMQKAGLTRLPLEGSKQNDVSTGRVHLVTLSWVDCLLLHCVNLETFKLHVQNLAQVHHHRLMNLLPQMGSENLNQRNL